MTAKHIVVIEKDGVKRELEAPFNICLSQETARWLREQLAAGAVEDFTYGWLRVEDETPMTRAINQPPRKWTE